MMFIFLFLCICIAAGDRINTFSDIFSYYDGILNKYSEFYDRSVFYGFWHAAEKYGSKDRDKLTTHCAAGCDCGQEILDCTSFPSSSSKVELHRHGFHKIINSSFPETVYPSVTQISIVSCSNLIMIESYVLEKFPNIETLVISDTQLQRIPAFQSRFESLINIDFYKNRITRVSKRQFDFVPNLKYLNLAMNQLNYVADNAFLETSLNYVSFAFNKLKSIPKAFKTISSNIEYIGLEGNTIDTVSSEALSDLPSLKHLNISNNPITSIEYGAFLNCPLLNFIEIHSSAMSKIEEFSFQEINDLVYISLYRTPTLISVAGNAFVNLPSVKVVEFQFGSLTFLDFRAFKNTPNLEFLSFDNNELTAIPHMLFVEAKLDELQLLSLSNNKISDISSISKDFVLPGNQILKSQFDFIFPLNESSVALPKLKYLYLSGNLLKGLPGYYFTALSSLNHIFLENNLIDDEFVDVNAFTESCISLTSIYLNNNNLQAIPKSLYRPLNVITIGLNYNLLTYLKRGTFTSLVNLANLYIANNNILTIEDGTFPESLKILDLSHNKFNFLDENQFGSLTELVSIKLNHNSITYLPDAVFVNNIKLDNINLDNNKLGWIKSIYFRDTPLSGNIYISNNQIRSIEHGTFANKNYLLFSAANNQLSNLPDDCMFCNLTGYQVQIYLQGNILELVHLKMFSNIKSTHTIDLSSNHISDVMINAFENIGLLYKIDLSGNPINTIESNSFNHLTSLTTQSTIDLSDIHPLSVIRSQTFNNVEVHKVDLTSNKIVRIEREAFNNVNIMTSLLLSDVQLTFIAKHVIVGYVKNIYLQNNKLERLVQGAFEKTTCQNIDLSNNQIKFVDKMSLPHCTELSNLNDNFISKLIKNIIAGGSSLSAFTLRYNKIEEIEMDAFVSLKTNLKSLDLRDNNLPSFSEGLLTGFKNLATLSLSGNNIRTLEKQAGVTGLISLNIDANNNRLRYFNQEILNSLALEDKTGILTVTNTVENPLPCACSNFEAFTALSEKDLIQFNDIQFCDFNGITFSFDKSSADYFATSTNKLLCEPFITEFTRETTNWVDDVPDKEQVNISWEVKDTALWNNNKTFCCIGDGSNNCLTIFKFNVKCYSDHDNALMIEESVSIVNKEECGFTFSTFFTMNHISSSIACTVDVTANSKTSPPSPYSVAYPENEVSLAVSCQKRDFPLSVTYFDFNNNIHDFQNLGDDNIISNVHYENHLFGPFLYKTGELLSSWFTVNSATSAVLQEEVCLDKQRKGRYKWFARNWYPLDSIVEEELLDRDENFRTHNLYFTARASFTFLRKSIDQDIWVGGPDDIWIFVGGLQVLELLAEIDDSALLPCARVVFSITGVTVNYGTLDFVKGATQRCILTGIIKESPDMIFENQAYLPVDIFLTQRRSLSSSLYLEFNKIDPKSFLAPRYHFNVSENKLPGGLIANLSLVNNQEINGPYTIKIKTNDQYGLLKENTYDFVEDLSEHSPYTHADEGLPEYYNCTEGENVWSPLNKRATVILDADSSNFYLILRKKLDYETLNKASREIKFVIELTFENFELSYSFENCLLALITDANDNCAVFTDGISISYQPVYSLSVEGKQVVVDDADSNENQNIEFYLGKVTRPENENVYLSLVDYYLYETVFLTYNIEVHAIDKGNNRYGASADITVTISSGCIRNMEFVIDRESGLFRVAAPGWMVSSHNTSYCESCTVGYRCPGNGMRIKCTSCLQEYEDEKQAWPDGYSKLDKGCIDPSLAEFSFGGSSECQDCKPGWICKEGLAHPVLEKMKHVQLCTNAACNDTLLDCQPGYSCSAGVADTCGLGTYNDGNFERCQLCPVGTFASTEGSHSCACCPEGKESSHGKERCEYCSWTDIYSVCGACRSCKDSVECPCLGTAHGCFTGQPCVNMPDGSNLCLECPEGSEAVAGSCSDVDECGKYSPCFEGVSCTNLTPGFKCGPCPSGYTGTSPQGVGEAEPQQCEDVDECLTDNGGCDVNAECINVPGSVTCGPCGAGLIGSGLTACTNGNFCYLGNNECHEHADCIYTGPGAYTCLCRPKYAGDGFHCGLDTDLDGYPDSSLNCDKPACQADNCPTHPNSDQGDIDLDNVGDVCDSDTDGDTIINEYDPCPSQVTEDVSGDSDGDGVPDACDNCVDDVNPYQQDSDGNGVGDHCQCLGEACYTDPVCSDTLDSDGDSIPDVCDNCPSVHNAMQSDVDDDGAGDSCDDDTDGDSIPDSKDNCRLVSNEGQSDVDGDGVGDICDDSTSWPNPVSNKDSDGDGVVDTDDCCPSNPSLSTCNFVHHSVLRLAPGAKEGIWLVSDKGRSINQIEEGVGPDVLLSEHRYDDLDYNGTFYVESSSSETGYIGIVFGYQGPGEMYILVWRRDYKTWLHGNCGFGCYNGDAMGGTTGLQLRRVHISTTNKDSIQSLLWFSGDSVVSTLMWQHPNHVSWQPDKAYRWFLSHRPSTGAIRIRVYSGADGLIMDSGKIYDLSYLGGKIGVYNFHQSKTKWSNIRIACVEPESSGLQFSDNYVNLGTISELQLSKNFVISAWVYLVDTVGGIQPILCTPDNILCLFVDENFSLVGSLRDTILTHSTALEKNAWYLVAIKADFQNKLFAIFRNEIEESVELKSSPLLGVEETNLYLGSDLTNNLKGFIADVRIISELLMSETISVLLSPSLERQRNMGIVSLHLNFREKQIQDLSSQIQVISSIPPPSLVPLSITGQMHQLQLLNDLHKRKRRYAEQSFSSNRSYITSRLGFDSRLEMYKTSTHSTRLGIRKRKRRKRKEEL